MRWYAEQIYLDEKDDFETKRDFVEYMASFWNPEAVNRIKEGRAYKESHNFATDAEFERQLLDRDYKDNPYVQAIIKLRKEDERNANNQELNEEKLYDSGIKLPTDLKFLKDY